jgi:flagellar basal-body rod protein FlgB
MSPKLFTDQLNVLKRGLDYASLKNSVISSNIANIETPGYKAFSVVMDEKLSKSGTAESSGTLKTTHPNHLTGTSKSGSSHLSKTHTNHLSGKSTTSGDLKVTQNDGTSMRVDGNNVDLEHELAELSANAVYYTTLSRFISSSFTGLRKAISEGRK